MLTFAPVQGFISSSRKLRDLYGGSLLLSYLAKAIIADAEQRLGKAAVLSPALVSTSRGTPNQLVIRGEYRKGHGRDALQKAWATVLDGCRSWLEQALADQFRFDWQKSWDQVRLHSWEYFHAHGDSISQARARLRQIKQARDWQAINWTGESSTLSGSAAVCRPQMAAVIDPRQVPPGQVDEDCQRFAAELRHPRLPLGEAFIDLREQVALPELVKRLVTYGPIARQALPGESLDALLPERFQEIAAAERVVWFMADGDRVGEHLSVISKEDPELEAENLRQFSSAMRSWAQQLYTRVPDAMMQKATVIYAGGDDLLGALHDGTHQQLTRADLFVWLQTFATSIWPDHQQNITVSMGLVWSEGQVPQREALAQLRQAEQHAKLAGRDRFALRVLFRSGRHLEWICPWRLLPRLLQAAGDQSGFWQRLSSDLEQLQARRGLVQSSAETLWQAHFGDRLALPAASDLGQQSLADWMKAMARVLATLPTT